MAELRSPSDPLPYLVAQWFAEEAIMCAEPSETPAYYAAYKRCMAIEERLESAKATTVQGAYAAARLMKAYFENGGGQPDLEQALIAGICDVLTGLVEGQGVGVSR